MTIAIAETMHHIPGLGWLNAFGTDHLALQLLMLAAGLIAFLLITLLSLKRSCENFEMIDL